MTNNKQQTAVEWLIEQMPLGIRKTLSENGIDFQQAKEMEKGQIMKAHISAGARLEDISIEAAEQYYEQTYGGGEQ